MNPRRAQAGRENQRPQQEPRLQAGPRAPRLRAALEQRDGQQTQAAQQEQRPPAATERQTQGQLGLQRQATSRNRQAAGVRQAWVQAQELRDEEPT